MIIKISVPYTDMVLACDSLQYELERPNPIKIELIIDNMIEQGYDMDVFFYDYDFKTNFRKCVTHE